MMAGYRRLPIEEFGRELITTGDLDPLYIGLAGVEWDSDQLYRFLVSYWCFYDAGVASYMSELQGEEFWQRMLTAAENAKQTPIGTRWPRSAERRHFRGQQAIRAVEELRDRYGEHPEAMVRYVSGMHDKDHSFKTVTDRVKEHRGFGDWISFKVADMLERLDIAPVKFGFSDAMYDSPVKAALTLARERNGYAENVHLKPEVIVPAVLSHLADSFKDLSAPPTHDRPLGLQEYETVLCKWGSHLSGHYPSGKDTHEIRNGVALWRHESQAARELLHHLPRYSRGGSDRATPGPLVTETVT